MSRPLTTWCEGCGTTIEVQPLGRPRRKCDDCRTVAQRTAERRWRAENPDAHRRHNRESARRRRAAGRTT